MNVCPFIGRLIGLSNGEFLVLIVQTCIAVALPEYAGQFAVIYTADARNTKKQPHRVQLPRKL